MSAGETRPAAPTPSFDETRRADASESGLAPAAPAAPEASLAAFDSAAALPRAPRHSQHDQATTTADRAARISRTFSALRRTDETASYGDGEQGFPRSGVSAAAPSGTADPQPAVHFAHHTSRLAGLLMANLVTTDAAPPSIHGGAEVPPLASHGSPHVTGEAACERQADDDVSGEAAGLSVEAVIEELYERLRLEFLRTYGTSGE